MKLLSTISLVVFFSAAATAQKFAIQVLPPLAFNYDARMYTQDELGTSVMGADVYILFLKKVTIQGTLIKNFKDVISKGSKPNVTGNASDSIVYPYKPFVDNEIELTWNFISISPDKPPIDEGNLWKAVGVRGGFIENTRLMPVYTQQWEKYYGSHGFSTTKYGYDTVLYKLGRTNLSTSLFNAGISLKTAYKKEKALYGLMSRTKDHGRISNNYAKTGEAMRHILWEVYFDVLHTTGLNYDSFTWKRATVNVDPSTFYKTGWRFGAQRIVMNRFGTGIKIEFGNMPGQKQFSNVVEGSHSFGKNMYLQIGFTLSAGLI